MDRRVESSARARGAALLVGVGVLLGTPAALVAPAAAFAAPYPPTAPCALSVDAAALSAGHTVHVSGTGYGPDLTVSLELRPTDTMLGTARTDTTGGFVTDVQLPTTLRAGPYLLVASSSSTSCQVRTVAPEAGPTAPPGSTTPGSTTPGSTTPGPTSTVPAPATSADQPANPSANPQAGSSGSGPAIGPIVLTAALVALLILGGTWLMLLLTGRPRT